MRGYPTDTLFGTKIVTANASYTFPLFHVHHGLGTAPIFLDGFISSQGLFLAKLCAAATLVSLPVLIAGFAAQDKLVRGLSLGAVK